MRKAEGMTEFVRCDRSNAGFALDANGTRSAPGFGAISVLMPPGRYTVQLSADGAVSSSPVIVRKDPNISTTELEIRASVAAQLQLQSQMAAAGEWVTQMESVRRQVQQLTSALESDRSNADLKPAVDSLGNNFTALENKVLDLRQTGQGQDGVRWPVQLAGQLGYLQGNLSASAGAAPTVEQRSVYTVLDRQARVVKTTLDGLVQKDLKALNSRLTARGLKPIEITLPKVVF